MAPDPTGFSLEVRKVFFKVLARVPDAALAPAGLGLAQLDAADLARDGLGQLGDELDAAHALVGRQRLARKGQDVARSFSSALLPCVRR
jgi:hypothetical protein